MRVAEIIEDSGRLKAEQPSMDDKEKKVIYISQNGQNLTKDSN